MIKLSFLDKARDYLSRRRYAYTKCFGGPLGEEVLRDLAKFCRAHQSTFHPDARQHAVLEGRREVFIRIQQHLQLTDDELWELFAIPQQTRSNE